MGLWSFVKESGASLFGKADAATAPEPEAIKAAMDKVGLDTTGVEIKVEGDKVKVEGTAVTPEMKEKIILAAGNVQGVATVEAESDAAAPVFYTVKKGDNLSTIAQHTLGKASLYTAIFEANKPMLSHPDKIYPGQMLRIPPATV
ncbi:MAG: peptidoglycan-binding protein LysM [Cypionkella sp.]|uniref:peptidoglycan-binding protein LysM n=1 Tax=Cypionkella sp. TaxID=2811411 RepID=UPI0026220F16|nr:peptidoglycan-binding protein LysM [Cypionkella sp.]MDB5661269.1 peptidoglycan-binding protein LysM [Cypionkella sp.]